jgi:hypothetical protein
MFLQTEAKKAVQAAMWCIHCHKMHTKPGIVSVVPKAGRHRCLIARAAAYSGFAAMQFKARCAFDSAVKS